MQYLLTEDEMRALQARATPAQTALVDATLEAAAAALLRASGFVCVKDQPRAGAYCDDCPLSHVPAPGCAPPIFTKDQSRLLCKKSRSYSQ